jgi:aminopeptidase N
MAGEKMRKFVLFSAFVVTIAPIAGAQRLPELAKPQHYQILVAPDLDKEKFAGEETIDINVLKATPSLTLNSAEIQFGEVTVTAGGQTQTAEVAPDEKNEMVTFKLAKPLEAGPASIHIRYTGILNGQLRGFYISKGNNRKYALTQLENTDARRMYPSFDEPDYKATFDLAAIVDKGDSAISNGKVISDTPGPGEGKHTVKFATTPKMSSYLVALAVGDWECLEGSADNIPIRICGVPGSKANAGFALAAAEYTLKYYNNYFGIKYPYAKLDILGVPDFAAGAMENTACIIARDLIFVDPKQSSYPIRKFVAQGLVAHEIAHQWFGDLVTMKWWDDVWLNEGFATWMSFKPMEAWKPEWNFDSDFVGSNVGAMATDALSSTRAIHAHAETPAQIEELFDSIAYNKAGAVLRMVEGYVGEETFRKGVNSYLTKHSYGNATAEDFWNEIAEVSHKPVDRIMSSFINQPGFPLVTVKTACTGGKTKVTLTQQRFFSDRTLLEAGSSEVWNIPVCLKAGKAEKCELLASKEQQVEFDGCGAGVYGNAGGRGYYRSGYEAENLRHISASAERDLSPSERYLLLDDVNYQIQVNRLSVGDLMNLARDMKDDPSTTVVNYLAGELQFVDDYLVTSADRSQFESWVRATFGPAAEKTGWTPAPNESDEALSRRADLLSIVGYIGQDPHAIQVARDTFTKALQGEPEDSALLGASVRIAVKDGDEKLYNAILGRIGHATRTDEYYTFGRALTLFDDPALLTRTLEFAVGPMMRGQDAAAVFGGVFSNPAGRQLAWDFVRQHWAEVAAKLNNYSEAGIVGNAGSFCDAAKRDEVQQFFTEHKVEAAERTLKLTIEQINSCIDLRSHQEPNLQTWLQHQSGSGGGAVGVH